jgi:hypothetical protein
MGNSAEVSLKFRYCENSKKKTIRYWKSGPHHGQRGPLRPRGQTLTRFRLPARLLRLPDLLPSPHSQGFFSRLSGRTAAIQFRYTGPVQPGTAQNRMNSNFKSKSVVQSVWSGIPTGSTGSRSYNQKTALVENLTCFQIWIKNGK